MVATTDTLVEIVDFRRNVGGFGSAVSVHDLLLVTIDVANSLSGGETDG